MNSDRSSARPPHRPLNPPGFRLDGSRPHRLRPHQLRRISSFVLVGGIATAVHVAIAWTLLAAIGGMAANAVGFAAALAVSYLGNYLLTFASTHDHGHTVIRFLAVSLAALAGSEWVLLLLDAAGARPAVAVFVAVAVTPAVRYAALGPAVFDRRHDTPIGSWLAGGAVWAVAAASGLAVLATVAPDGMLDPDSALWQRPSGDLATGLTGMRYYLADDWHWPLLLTDDLDAPRGTVIAYTDSIPLLALPLKLARPLLGDDLNYFPAWYLLAFTLQGVSAVALLRSLRVRRPLTLMVGAVLAVSFPAFVFRAAMHPALAGHFVVLLALAAAFAAGRPTGADGDEGKDQGETEEEAHRHRITGHHRLALTAIPVTLVIALLVHPYLAIMSLPPVAGVLVDHVRRGRLPISSAVRLGASTLVLVAAVMVAGGYTGRYLPSNGYGHHGLVVNGPVTPQLSALFPDHGPLITDGSAEGFNWLGAGAVAALAGVAVSGQPLLAVARRHPGLLAGMAALTGLAISHRVAYGRHGLLDLSPLLQPVLDRPTVPVAATVAAVSLAAAVYGRRLVRRQRTGRPELKGAVVVPAVVTAILLAGGAAVTRLSLSSGFADALSAIRASGRLFWPVGLLLTLGPLVLLDRGPRRRTAAVLAAVAVLQVIDTGPIRQFTGAVLPTTNHLGASAPLLAGALSASDQLHLAPTVACSDDVEVVLASAAVLALASVAGRPVTNSVYAARPPADVDCDAMADPTVEGVEPGELLLAMASYRHDPGRLLDREGWCRDDGTFLACTDSWAAGSPADTAPFLPVVAEPLRFGSGGDGDGATGPGWGSPGELTLSVPRRPAELRVPVAVTVDGALTVRLRLGADTAASLTVTGPTGGRQVVPVAAGPDHDVDVVFPHLDLEPGDDLVFELSAVEPGARIHLASLFVLAGSLS